MSAKRDMFFLFQIIFQFLTLCLIPFLYIYKKGVDLPHPSLLPFILMRRQDLSINILS